MDTKQKPQKEKRRNNEKRKEKSRDAARCRRSRETEIFTDLSKALPLPQEEVSQLDKASVMRLAISYLKVRDMIKLVSEVQSNADDISCDESVYLNSMDGFVLVISSDGDFVYLSDNVSDYLGISQVDLMGQNMYDYSHPCDHDEIKDILSARSQDSSDLPKSFFIRLKCTLTSKGRSVNLKSATYKVIHCTGHMVYETDENSPKKGNRFLVAIGQPIPHPSNIEAPLPSQTFLTKHSLDMKFTYADDKMMEFLGYSSEDLLGKSLYEYHHATDSDSIASAYKCLFSKGQCETSRYRFLAKTGGYIWVLTQATLIYDKMQKPQSIVCVNFVISGIECKDEIYSAFQLSSSSSAAATVKPNSALSVKSECAPAEVTEKEKIDVPKESKPLVVTAKLFVDTDASNVAPRPQTATSKIFAPRTEEMSKGFLTFSDEEPGLTLLKEEPDDLTHLAPVAGDVVPLEDHPFLTDMLDDFLLRGDGFCPLLADEPADPFISYRDSCDHSPQLLSPNLLKSSDCSLQSLNSPTESLSEEDQMSTFMSLQMEDDQEMINKAPYIPMSMGDDLPLLLPDDIMWSTNDRSKASTPDNTSSLAQLLSSGVNKHTIKSNDHGGSLLQTTVLDNYYDKSPTWNPVTKQSHRQTQEKLTQISTNRSNKRMNNAGYELSNKRTKSNPSKENAPSELLQQLISNNATRQVSKGKVNWLLDTGGRKATCISQPSESVLMNLLDEQLESNKAPNVQIQKRLLELINRTQRRDHDEKNDRLRKKSISLLDPEAAGIPSLLDLTQQDYEVNAPVNNFLLQGEELITALDISEVI